MCVGARPSRWISGFIKEIGSNLNSIPTVCLTYLSRSTWKSHVCMGECVRRLILVEEGLCSGEQRVKPIFHWNSPLRRLIFA